VNRQIGVEESRYRVTGDPHLQIVKGSRDLFLKFWDPLHSSLEVLIKTCIMMKFVDDDDDDDLGNGWR